MEVIMQTLIPAQRALLAINNDLTVIAGRAWLLQRRQQRGELGPAIITDDLTAIEAAVKHLGVLVPRLAADAAASPRTP